MRIIIELLIILLILSGWLLIIKHLNGLNIKDLIKQFFNIK